MVLAETGVAGGGAALAFLVAWRRRASPARRGFAAGAVLFMAACLANVGAEYLVNQITLGLFMGIAVAAAAAPRWRPRLSAAIVAGAGAVLLLPLLAAPFLASRMIVDGKDRLARSDAAGAFRLFDSAAGLDPTSWEAYDGRALSRWSNPAATDADRALAIDDVRQAVSLNRLDGTLWLEEGEMLRDVGRRDEARAALRKAAALRRNDPRIAEALEKLSGP
jgi:tetratricopeptide (TPR) repeat protein